MALSGKINDPKMVRAFKAEIGGYINEALDHEKERRMQEVYITDHSHKKKMFLTNSKKEDKEFFRIAESLKEWNAAPVKKNEAAYSGRYPRGSLAQRVFEPLALTKRDENGTLVVDLN
jgi:hypothetical protein